MTGLIINRLCSASVNQGVTAMSLPCHCRVTAASLLRHCRVTVASLLCHCRVTASSLSCHCRITAVSLPRHCRVTAASLPCHCRVTAVSLGLHVSALPRLHKHLLVDQLRRVRQLARHRNVRPLPPLLPLDAPRHAPPHQGQSPRPVKVSCPVPSMLIVPQSRSVFSPNQGRSPRPIKVRCPPVKVNCPHSRAVSRPIKVSRPAPSRSVSPPHHGMSSARQNQLSASQGQSPARQGLSPSRQC